MTGHEAPTKAWIAARARPQLSPEHREVVRSIIEKLVPAAVVFVFGSRATGRARPYSDLDLLFVRPKRLDLQQRMGLADGFEASNLPFRVDIVEVDALENGMRSRIHEECVPL